MPRFSRRRPLAPEAALPRARAGARALAIDVSPLRESRDFRLLWTGEMLSEPGYHMTLAAVFYQVYALTRSEAAVGLLGLVALPPLVLSSILGGPLVDTYDRRKILVLTQAGLALTSLVLVAGALMDRPPLWIIYAAAALRAAFGGISGPARSAMTPNLVSRERLPAALALNQVMWNGSQVIGPAVGGVLIGAVGIRWVYALDAVTYLATITAALMMRPQPPARGEGASKGLRAVREGFAYLKGNRVIQSTFTVDLVAMIFGMPRAVFPALALTAYGPAREAAISGLFFAAPAFGALIGALTAGWVGRVERQGRAVLLAVAVWGAGIAAAGLTAGVLPAALFFLGLAGAADVVSAVFRGTILQTSVPDELRGRLSGIHILVVTGGPRLGDVEAGIAAALVSPVFSVVSGGLACIAGVAVIARLVPEFVRYRLPKQAVEAAFQSGEDDPVPEP